MARTARRWTPTEEDLIRQHYPANGARIPELAHRTPTSIHKRAVRLGVSHRPNWTPAEDALVLRHAHHSLERAQQALARAGSTRSLDAIRIRAYHLGNRPPAYRRRAWTTTEDGILHARYRACGGKATVRALTARGYDRTLASVHERAGQLGLRTNPQGRKIAVTYKGKRAVERDRVLSLLTRTFPLPLDHEDIAERLGIPALAAAQHLKNLRDEGAVVRLDCGALHVPAHAHARAA